MSPRNGRGQRTGDGSNAASQDTRPTYTGPHARALVAALRPLMSEGAWEALLAEWDRASDPDRSDFDDALAVVVRRLVDFRRQINDRHWRAES